MTINLDQNATTPPSPAAIHAAMQALQAEYGNPSSAHEAGNKARNLLIDARAQVANLLHCAPDRLIFTGSGTEANNMAIHSLAMGDSNRLVTSPIEHSSIGQHANHLARNGMDVVKAYVGNNGRVDADSVEDAIKGVDRPAISIQWVNNETGAIQPVESLVEMAKRYGARIHIDAAQAFGKLPCDIDTLDPDFLSVTAHKINGVRGVGALYVRDPNSVMPMRFGGTQEQGIHPGTENLAGIAALGAAAAERRDHLNAVVNHMEDLRNTFENRLLGAYPWGCINAGGAPRVANTTNIRLAGIDGEALMARLDMEGIYCSQGSACTNQKPEPSFVLRAMGLSEPEAYESIRFSVGQTNTRDEIIEAADTTAQIANQLRRLFA